MKWYCGLESITEEHVHLAERTWYKIGGRAQYFCTPRNPGDVQEIVHRAREQGLPYRVLGAGANVLVRDEGFNGVVIQLDTQAFGQFTLQGSRLCAGAAAQCPNVVRHCVDAGQAGLEVMAGIPGTIGGVLRMNAGGRFGDISETVHSVRGVDALGTPQTWSREHLTFAYRDSNLRDCIVLEAAFNLTPRDPQALRERYTEIWDFKQRTQPFTRNNAGCTFKNPESGKAGALIDQAGLKGLSCGGASVCEKHANFLVAEPGTSTADILELTRIIQERVHDTFNVDLELEIEVW